MAEVEHWPTTTIAADSVGFSRLVVTDVAFIPAAQRAVEVERIARPLLNRPVSSEEAALGRAANKRDLKVNRLSATTVPPPVWIERAYDR